MTVCAGIMPMSPELSQFLRLFGALCFGRCALDSLDDLLARAFVYFATAAALFSGRNQPPVNAPLIGRNGDWVGASRWEGERMGGVQKGCLNDSPGRGREPLSSRCAAV